MSLIDYPKTIGLRVLLLLIGVLFQLGSCSTDEACDRLSGSSLKLTGDWKWEYSILIYRHESFPEQQYVDSLRPSDLAGTMLPKFHEDGHFEYFLNSWSLSGCAIINSVTIRDHIIDSCEVGIRLTYSFSTGPTENLYILSGGECDSLEYLKEISSTPPPLNLFESTLPFEVLQPGYEFSTITNYYSRVR